MPATGEYVSRKSLEGSRSVGAISGDFSPNEVVASNGFFFARVLVCGAAQRSLSLSACTTRTFLRRYCIPYLEYTEVFILLPYLRGKSALPACYRWVVSPNNYPPGSTALLVHRPLCPFSSRAEGHRSLVCIMHACPQVRYVTVTGTTYMLTFTQASSFRIRL